MPLASATGCQFPVTRCLMNMGLGPLVLCPILSSPLFKGPAYGGMVYLLRHPFSIKSIAFMESAFNVDSTILFVLYYYL